MFAAAATTPTTTPGLTKHDNGTKTSDYSDGCNFSEDIVTLDAGYFIPRGKSGLHRAGC